jgi:hypothetical protein
MRRSCRFVIACVLCAFLFSLPVRAQEVEVDISACRGMYAVLETMREGAPKEKVSQMLDALLESSHLPNCPISVKRFNPASSVGPVEWLPMRKR